MPLINVSHYTAAPQFPHDPDAIPEFDTPRSYSDVDLGGMFTSELRAQYLGQYNSYLRKYVDRAREIALNPSVLRSWNYPRVLGQHYEGKHVRTIYRPILLADDLEVLSESIELAWGELRRRDELHWQLEADEFASATPHAGFVYLMELSPEMNFYKIGITTDPERRLKQFDATKLPFEVRYAALIATQDMNGVERGLHRRFEDQRVRGEWFALTSEDVEYIKGLAK